VSGTAGTGEGASERLANVAAGGERMVLAAFVPMVATVAPFELSTFDA